MNYLVLHSLACQSDLLANWDFCQQLWWRVYWLGLWKFECRSETPDAESLTKLLCPYAEQKPAMLSPSMAFPWCPWVGSTSARGWSASSLSSGLRSSRAMWSGFGPPLLREMLNGVSAVLELAWPWGTGATTTHRFDLGLAGCSWWFSGAHRCFGGIRWPFDYFRACFSANFIELVKK